MDDHALSVVEFPALLTLIGGRARTATGKASILGLRPKTHVAAIEAKHPLYREALAVIDKGLFRFDLHFEDLSDILRRAAPEGAVLGGDDLVLCRTLLDVVGALQRTLKQEDYRPFTALRDLVARSDSCEALARHLHECLDKDGALLDSASGELRDLRRRARSLEQQIQRTLEHLLHAPRYQVMLQEHFVTLRNGRFVIPVRRDVKGEVAGVIHDHSNSGQTVFVEPTETLPLGNELADVRLEEKDECLRILSALSAAIRDAASPLRENQWVLTEFDAALAVGQWAHDHECSFPRFGRELRLVRGRHPLLLEQFGREGRRQVVPIDVLPPTGVRVVVITGSNTGGKTVALKTVGLLVLAAQAGLPVSAAPESEFELFDLVLADIGDEQSLVSSLSTFSGHMAQITRILQASSSGRTLVLLDELGAGTDPVEGGALACAILLELAGRNALTLATTHLGVVKSFAHEQAHMVNAAVRFNPDTLAPEYALDFGRPGASHALKIAERLGVPAPVLSRAADLLSGDHLRLESMLASMEEDQRQLSQREQEAQHAAAELTRDRDQAQEELRQLRRERRRLLHDAYQQASGIVENTRRQMEALLRDLRCTPSSPSASDVAPVPVVVARAREALVERLSRVEKGLAETGPRPEVRVDPRQLRVGQSVWVERLGTHGTVAALAAGGASATVQVGAVRFTLSARELGTPESGTDETAATRPPPAITRPQPRGTVPLELNLIGLYVDDALARLEGYLNQAALANLPTVRIVHGFGTGRLRDGIHTRLRNHPLVREYKLGREGEDPGGAGATVVVMNY